MSQNKQIFIQVDTDSLALLDKAAKNHIESEDVLKHTIICKQGAMSMGSSVADFNIKIAEGDKIFFTLIPLKLFSEHKLIFHFDGEYNSPIKPKTDNCKVNFKLITTKKNPFSFGIKIKSVPSKFEYEDFNIDAELILDTDKTIKFCIDPRLKAKPGG